MSLGGAEQVMRYAHPSQLDRDGSKQVLRLATVADAEQHSPYFFEARLASPVRAAKLLTAVMRVVKSRFHVPAAMLNRILAEADPVVTCNDDVLRFEGFSACCGAYSRADFESDSFDGDVSGRGTTNVDFNQPMLAALARLKPTEDVSIAVGSDEVCLQRQAGAVVEKKVKLPVRWLRGLIEVQAVQHRMEKVHEVAGVHAFRFLRSLPRVKTHRRETYVVASGAGLRLSQLSTPQCVRVGGLERLAVLEPLVREAKTLGVYSDQVTGASGWVLELPGARFTVVISPEVWRGFSGEGQVLSELAAADRDGLAQVRAALKWQAVITAEAIAKSAKVSKSKADVALSVLATQGLVGFDLFQQSYFHRELPFNVSDVEKLQPRLIDARKLVAEHRVSQVDNNASGDAVFEIDRPDVKHRVVVKANQEDDVRCSCPWYHRHGQSRGPCKHILAVQIYLEESGEG